MNVYIPSRSRPARSLTLEAMELGGVLPRVRLVVPTAQAPAYAAGIGKKHGVAVLPCPARGIAHTREWIGQHAMEEGVEKFIMFDDDLRFFYRKDDGVRLYKFEASHFSRMLRDVFMGLDRYAHMAISAREGNNQLKFPYVENKRPLRVLAYRTVPFLSVEHGRVQIMEDFDVTLQLMKDGYKNCVITKYAQDQAQTQNPGGCSDYRTHELHEANVKKMAELHHPFIKLRTKENKTGGEFGSRLEATIYWQKAYQSSLGDL